MSFIGLNLGSPSFAMSIINSLNNVVGSAISKLVPQNTIMLSILSLPINLFILITGLDNDIIY